MAAIILVIAELLSARDADSSAVAPSEIAAARTASAGSAGLIREMQRVSRRIIAPCIASPADQRFPRVAVFALGLPRCAPPSIATSGGSPQSRSGGTAVGRRL